MSFIYEVRPPNRFQVEIIEVEKVKVDLLRLKYLVRIETGRELSQCNCVANSVSYLTMRQSHTPQGACGWCGRPEGQRPIIPRWCIPVYIQRSYRRTGLNLFM